MGSIPYGKFNLLINLGPPPPHINSRLCHIVISADPENDVATNGLILYSTRILLYIQIKKRDRESQGDLVILKHVTWVAQPKVAACSIQFHRANWHAERSRRRREKREIKLVTPPWRHSFSRLWRFPNSAQHYQYSISVILAWVSPNKITPSISLYKSDSVNTHRVISNGDHPNEMVLLGGEFGC